MIKKGLFGLSSTIILSLIALACQSTPPSGISVSPPQPSASEPAVSQEETVPVQAGQVSASYIEARSVEELTAKSSIIAIGTVSDLNYRQEMLVPGRNPNDLSQPDPNYTAVRVIYNVNVERYLKGQGSNTVSVVQTEAAITPDRQGNKTRFQFSSANFPLQKGVRYLLFLRTQNRAPEFVAGPAQPYRFILSNGTAKAESPDLGILQLFPDTTEAELIAQVEQLVRNP